MKSVEWGLLYNEFGSKNVNIGELENKIKKLMEDEDVTSKKGIYEYVLSGREKVLSIRAFSPNQKREAYERQNYHCPRCETSKEWEI